MRSNRLFVHNALTLVSALSLCALLACSDDTKNANNGGGTKSTSCEGANCATNTGGGTSGTNTSGTNTNTSSSTNTSTKMCSEGRAACGVRCCGRGFACDVASNQCQCASNTVCNGVCCGDGQSCEAGVCVDPCEGTRCGAELDQCCMGSAICLGGSCVEPGKPCDYKEDCAGGETCDTFVKRCVPAPAQACEYKPTPGDFEPVIACEWRPTGLAEPAKRDVVMAPIVLDLADEGEPQGQEIPELAFISFDLDQPRNQGGGCCNSKGVLRIVSGKCDGKDMRTIASITEPALSNDVGIAAGDLDGDGIPEIVGILNKETKNAQGVSSFFSEGLVAFKRDNKEGTSWSPLWVNEEFPKRLVHLVSGGPTISIANIDGKGAPEVIVGSIVFDGDTGNVKWDASAGFMKGDTPIPGQGHNIFGPVSSVVDVDQDGTMEVLAGSTLYNVDGSVRARYDYTEKEKVGLTQCAHERANVRAQGRPVTCDGYNGVADINGDGNVDLVAVRLGQIFVWNSDMTLQWKVDVPTYDMCLNKTTGERTGTFRGNESGPPTIADFDGDGRPEIGTAGATYYVVADVDCDVDDWMNKGCAERGILWKTENEDCSSRSTASSVFDFEGDGKAEVVYVDEEKLFIYDGSTGKILFESPKHRSNTRIELPIIADIDNDNNAEIVMGSAWSKRATDDDAEFEAQTGLKVWKDAKDNWVRTRKIWNQHSYHVTNVNDDGTIPNKERAGWKIPALNSYRQNIQPSGLFDAPDLVVQSIETNESLCVSQGILEVYVGIGNEGALGVPDGLAYTVFALMGGQRIKIAEETTTERLFPGQVIRKAYRFTPPPSVKDQPITIEVKVDTDDAHNECKEDNNTKTLESAACSPLG